MRDLNGQDVCGGRGDCLRRGVGVGAAAGLEMEMEIMITKDQVAISIVAKVTEWA
jgi:hypothetical protein